MAILIKMDARVLRVFKEYSLKKKMKRQLLAMNDIAFGGGSISEDKYLELRRKLGADQKD